VDGGDRLARCTVGAAVGESLRLGGYVCEARESVERRRSPTCSCASMSPLTGPSTSALPSSPESEEEWKSGSRSVASAWSVGSAIPAKPPALTIESISQNWRIFMNIGKTPIVLHAGIGVLVAMGQYQRQDRQKWKGARTRQPGRHRYYLTN